MRHAIVNKDGLVVNVVIWNGARWKAPDNHYVVHSPIVNIGDTYDIENDIVIVTDRTTREDIVIEQKPEITLESLQEQIATLQEKLSQKGA